MLVAIDDNIGLKAVKIYVGGEGAKWLTGLRSPCTIIG
jgi:hypothetical protein